MWGFQNRVCLSISPCPEKRNRPGFVNISPTLVIDTSMEKCSRVLHCGNPKFYFFFFQKSLKLTKLNFIRTQEKKSPWFPQYQSYISNWYINGKVFMSTTAWKPKNLNFFKKVRNSDFDLYFVWLFLSLKLNFDLCRRAEIIQVGLNMHHMMTSGMHRRPFEGRLLVLLEFSIALHYFVIPLLIIF